MILLLDFGNSRCKWAQINTDKWRSGKAIEYGDDETGKRICETVEELPIDLCSEIHAVSVLGDEFDRLFADMVAVRKQIPVSFYQSCANEFEIQLAYDDPRTYGNDRYAALVAATRASSGTRLIIDCGTAVTLDIIDDKNRHLGGMIMPGIETMVSSLASRAPGIPLEYSPREPQLLSLDTESAVYSGSVLCLRYGLGSIIQQLKSLINAPLSIFVTGGSSAAIFDLSDRQFVYKPELVLEGLNIMRQG